ncbi:hypothetical protein CKO51_25280 [Rhodopirellula sp. SM50]|nr:hypothetical protein CKO51_25280 [Rhodopirellula sp. SM50]
MAILAAGEANRLKRTQRHFHSATHYRMPRVLGALGWGNGVEGRCGRMIRGRMMGAKQSEKNKGRGEE